MKVSNDVICQICKKSFCCAECRHKHEIKNHAIAIRRASKEMASNSGSQSGEDRDLVSTIYLFCPICAHSPFLLKEEMYEEILEHIVEHHLPLSCQKCNKIYTNSEDLREFSKCIQPQQLCQPDRSIDEFEVREKTDTKISGNTAHVTIATQTSPMRVLQDYNDSHITPISMINLRWKAKNKVTHEEFISDSASSLKNISSINNSSLVRSIGVLQNQNNKGKLVRTTSTPLQNEILFIKPKEQAFNGSAGHVSSIYNSGCDSESSIPAGNLVGTPAQQSLDVNRYRGKVAGRPKMATVTPLRQVMSKSIQKAFAEHGIAAVVKGGQYRKKIFESIDCSLNNPSSVSDATKLTSSPLDLRLSPALRRTSSEPSTMEYYNDIEPNRIEPSSKVCHEIVLSSKKTTTKSIVITRMQKMASVESTSVNSNFSTQSAHTEKSNDGSNGTTNRSVTNSSTGSVYQTCRSVEIITSTEMSAVKMERNSLCSKEISENLLQPHHSTQMSTGSDNFVPITPTARKRGAVIKKNHISFETPKEEINSHVDVFFTPEATPARKKRVLSEPSEMNSKYLELCNYNGRYSPSRRPALRECFLSSAFSRIEDVTLDNLDISGDDDVFTSVEEPDQEENKKSQASSLWSLMTSVIRIPSLTGGQNSKSNETGVTASTSRSIIKRCASIAGSIVRSKTFDGDEQLQPLKRKRTYTTDNQSTFLSHLQDESNISPVSDTISACSKRFRIQGRKPIERMRMNS